MKDTGKLLLKIASAVLMIFGVIAGIVAIIDLISKTGSTEWLISTIIVLLASVAEVILGYMGLKRSDDPLNSNFFVVTGFALVIVELICMIIHFTAWSLIGFLLPILYIAGGFMLRTSEAE